MTMTPVVYLSDMKEHLNIVGDDDNDVILNKMEAAEDWIAAYIGKPLTEFTTVPPSIKEAVRQLVAHLYENREATIIGSTIMEASPGLFDMLAPHREWTF